MLEGASLNAPYRFHWVFIKDRRPKEIVCTGGGEEMVLPVRQTRQGERAKVTVRDPIFGPLAFDVAPFKRNDP